MDDDRDYRDAVRMGLRRAGLHWLRAGYEIVAGLSALLDEVAGARKSQSDSAGRDPQTEGPVRIELE